VPSIIVNSGHGIHAYWRLLDPVSVTALEDRSHFEATVKGFASALGGDTTHDCTRLLRLPGTWNVKDKRNGALEVRCTLLSVDETRVYPLSAFDEWLHSQTEQQAISHREMRVDRVDLLANSYISKNRNQLRIQGALRYLDRDVPDRSRRDFAVLARCIQLGVSREELWQLVHDKSKFATHGETYFQRTFENALKRVGKDVGQTMR
jgi:hypothetical protein